MKLSLFTRLSLRTVALGYLFVLLVLPLAIILWRTFERGSALPGLDHHASGHLGVPAVDDHRGHRRRSTSYSG